MNIIVCIKRVPMTQEVDLEIDGNGRGVKTESLAYVINDWDNYCIEEAVRLQETFGGSVTAITIGSEDDEEVLRRALAMGADKAVRVDPGACELDGFVISNILAKVIEGMAYDLVLTGVQADDDNSGMVGIMIAEALGLSHAAVVTSLKPEGKDVAIRVELEGGMDEVSNIQLPSLLTIQTGINEPRYVSIMGIKKARKKELTVIPVADLGLAEDDLAPRTRIEQIFLPPETTGAEMIQGDAASVATELIRIIKEKGVNI
jgi:electron transfer flavoprotein beta subunit